MRKLIITFVLTAFIVTLSSPILNAAQWDYATGPNWPEKAYVERAFPSGEEEPWVDVEKDGEGINSIYNDIVRCFDFKLFFIIFFPIQDDYEDEITTGSYAESFGGDINSSRNTAGQ